MQPSENMKPRAELHQSAPIAIARAISNAVAIFSSGADADAIARIDADQRVMDEIDASRIGCRSLNSAERLPVREGVNFVHNALIGINARDRVRIGAAGKIATAFDMARAMAIGADWCNSARGFMFSLGCSSH